MHVFLYHTKRDVIEMSFQVYFTVLIESPVSTAAQTWQAAIWCRSKSDATERTLALKETKKDIPVVRSYCFPHCSILYSYSL